MMSLTMREWARNHQKVQFFIYKLNLNVIKLECCIYHKKSKFGQWLDSDTDDDEECQH